MSQIIQSMSEGDYRKAAGVNVSSLKPLLKSPLAYKYAKENPMTSTAAMTFGTALHALTLEPSRIRDEIYCVSPFDSFRTKEAQAWRDSQKVPVLTTEDSDRLHDCAAAVGRNELAAWILERTPQESRELSIFTELCGTPCKGRLDLVFTDLQDRQCVGDIKTCQDASKGAFERTVADRNYAMQAAFYLDLIGASDFYFIAVESGPPHEVAVYKLDDESIQVGRETYQRLLGVLTACQGEDKWPSASELVQGVQVISLPAWAKKNLK